MTRHFSSKGGPYFINDKPYIGDKDPLTKGASSTSSFWRRIYNRLKKALTL